MKRRCLDCDRVTHVHDRDELAICPDCVNSRRAAETRLTEQELVSDTISPEDAVSLVEPLTDLRSRVLRSLTPRERKVLNLRFGLSQDTATPELIKRAEQRALEKLSGR